MGIIQRQSIKQSIVNYLAVAIGFVNVFIYTTTFTTSQLGFYQVLMSTAAMIVPFVQLGSNNLNIRYFPQFKNEDNKHNGFLFLVLIYPFIGFLLFLIIAFIFKDTIVGWYIEDNAAYVHYFHYGVYLVLILSVISVLGTYSSNFKRIVVPAIFNNLLVKIAVPLLAILFYFEYLSFEGFIQAVVVLFMVVLLLLLGYVNWLGQLHLKPNFKLLNKGILAEMVNFQGYTLLVGMGSILATRIDLFMVATLLGWSYGGVYSIVLIISQVIEIPKQAIASIINPIISEAWKKNDLAHIDELYKKSALNQLIAGIFIFIGIWLSIDDLFSLIPNGEDYRSGKMVILILGIAKLVDMAAGVNGIIITYSKYFRFNFYAILVLAVLNVVNNYLLIPIYELNGAALATLFSVFIFNLVKLIYLKMKIGLQPFTWKTLWVIVIGLVSYFVVTLIPTVEPIFLNMFVKSVAVTVLYGALIVGLNVSEDINGIVNNGLDRFIKR